MPSEHILISVLNSIWFNEKIAILAPIFSHKICYRMSELSCKFISTEQKDGEARKETIAVWLNLSDLTHWLKIFLFNHFSITRNLGDSRNTVHIGCPICKFFSWAKNRRRVGHCRRSCCGLRHTTHGLCCIGPFWVKVKGWF